MCKVDVKILTMNIFARTKECGSEGNDFMKITICIGSSCHLKGSRHVIEELQDKVSEHGLSDKVELCGAFCMKNCVNGVSVTVDDVLFSVKPDTVDEFFENEILKKLG